MLFSEKSSTLPFRLSLNVLNLSLTSLTLVLSATTTSDVVIVEVAVYRQHHGSVT